jgi:predicted transport protein
MSDVRLFEISSGQPKEIQGQTAAIEKEVQTLIENNLEAFFAVRFLATEYSTGERHGGRIDTLGLDENNSPVILEYKRKSDENVITQGLYYLDWLMDHQDNFDALVRTVLGDIEVDWAAPRLICVAGEYKKFDLHATNQINRNIDLFRYEKYGKSHILFDLINSASAEKTSKSTGASRYGLASDGVLKASQKLQDVWHEIEDYVLDLGDDVNSVELKRVLVFKTIKNFVCIHIIPTKNIIRMTLTIDPKTVQLEDGFSRDMTGIGHWGTGNLQLEIKNKKDFEKAKPLIDQAYGEVS